MIYLLCSLPLTSRWSCDPAGWPQWSESVAGRRPPATDSCLCTEHTRLHHRRHHLLYPTATHTGNRKETNTVIAALYVTRNRWCLWFACYLDVESASVRAQSSALIWWRSQLSVFDLQWLQTQRRTFWNSQNGFIQHFKLIITCH